MKHFCIETEMSSLKHITTVLANDTIPVHKYKSERTGLTVVIGEVEGPIVNGYFTLGKQIGATRRPSHYYGLIIRTLFG